MIVRNANEMVMEVFEITGFVDKMCIRDSYVLLVPGDLIYVKALGRCLDVHFYTEVSQHVQR